MKQIIEVLQGIWAAINGRWFIWRNASDETVESVARLEFNESDAASLHEMVRQAKEELRARGQMINGMTEEETNETMSVRGLNEK